MLGIPAERLAELADDEGADLIVVGSRGVQGGLSGQRFEQPDRYRPLLRTRGPPRRRRNRGRAVRRGSRAALTR
jgi:nucleotide-binding universal stress UspA family protein